MWEIRGKVSPAPRLHQQCHREGVESLGCDKGGEFAHGCSLGCLVSKLGCLFSRQHKLEEALLFSGQFMDALQALVDWLYKVEPQLAEDQPVHGDLDLVMNLMDAHKVRAAFPRFSLSPERGKKTPQKMPKMKQTWLLEVDDS